MPRNPGFEPVRFSLTQSDRHPSFGQKPRHGKAAAPSLPRLHCRIYILITRLRHRLYPATSGPPVPYSGRPPAKRPPHCNGRSKRPASARLPAPCGKPNHHTTGSDYARMGQFGFPYSKSQRRITVGTVGTGRPQRSPRRRIGKRWPADVPSAVLLTLRQYCQRLQH